MVHSFFSSLRFRIIVFSLLICVLCVAMIVGLSSLKKAEVYYCYYTFGVNDNNPLTRDIIEPVCTTNFTRPENPYTTCEYKGFTYTKEDLGK